MEPRMTFRQILATTALLVLPNAANAEVDSAVTMTSDYRFQGVSSSSEHGVVQGYVHAQDQAGAYVGLFSSQVDYGYTGAPSYELDAYLGHSFYLDQGRTELKFEALYSAFPDNRTPGPTLNFYQAKAQAKRTVGRWSTGGLIAYVPYAAYGAGEVWRVEGEADFAATPNVTLKAQAGRQWGGPSQTRTYWSLATSRRWRRLDLTLSYVGNNRTRANCGFQPKACDDALVASITVNLPPLKP
jgi:uncharacterized protein (TIGR02001 family)